MVGDGRPSWRRCRPWCDGPARHTFGFTRREPSGGCCRRPFRQGRHRGPTVCGGPSVMARGCSMGRPIASACRSLANGSSIDAPVHRGRRRRGDTGGGARRNDLGTRHRVLRGPRPRGDQRTCRATGELCHGRDLGGSPRFSPRRNGGSGTGPRTARTGRHAGGTAGPVARIGQRGSGRAGGARDRFTARVPEHRHQGHRERTASRR